MRTANILIVAALMFFAAGAGAAAQTTLGPVTITSAPPAVSNAVDAAFAVRYDGPPADEPFPEVALRCAVDRAGDWLPNMSCGTCGTFPCSATHEFPGIGEGDWTFKIRATPSLAVPTPSGPITSYQFKIDRTPPVVVVGHAPPLITADTSASVSFSANEASTFACELNGVTAPCASPKSYVVGVGEHRFSVTPTDAAGNVGQAATVRWVVTPSLTVQSARLVGVQWKKSALRPGVALDARGALTPGTYAANTTWTLRHASSPQASVSFPATLTPPTFAPRFLIPPRSRRGDSVLAPGRYRLSVAGTAAGFVLPIQQRTLSVPAPPEGVVTNAGISTAPGGPHLKFVSKARGLWATFRFAPNARATRAVTAQWRDRAGRHAYRIRLPPRRRTLVTWYRQRGRDLANGRWTCTLKMGRTVIAHTSIRIGRPTGRSAIPR